MNSKEIRQQLEAVIECMDRADNHVHPTGNIITAIGRLVEISESLLEKIESQDRLLAQIFNNRE